MPAHKFIRWNSSGGIGRLTLNRPPLNVLTIPMMAEMGRALDDDARDPALKVLVLDAAPDSKAFSAGVDVADHTADKVEAMLETFHHVFHSVAALEIPTLAVVDGAALGGGCELALAFDLLVASERASFGQPEIKLGVFPPLASVLLPELVGPRKAAEMLFTGERIDAHEALRIGLANRVVPPDRLEAEVDGLAASLTALSGTALRLAKRAYRIGAPNEAGAKLAEVEALYMGELVATKDAQEGLAAFMENRAPQWTDS